jgi:putative FmdB family regulatory protein
MPMYEFECKKCNEQYVDLTSYDESGKYPNTKCPKCGSKKKDKLISKNVYVMNTSSQNNIFDIAAGKNMERAKAERRAAEEASHMGASPFGFNESGDFDMGEGIHDPEFRSGLS